MNEVRKTSITYVTRDIERALGRTPSALYRIVSNASNYAKQVKERYPEHVFLVETSNTLDTDELLSRPEVHAFISDSKVVVFKNTTRIERVAQQNNIDLINPSAKLATQIEEKISQVTWLGNLACHLPPHSIQELSQVTYDGKPFILQFNHAHTGTGTILITKKEQLSELQEKFPNRPVKRATFVEGMVYTLNICVLSTGAIYLGNISYQITGLAPFTNNPFATIGNDWGLAEKTLTQDQKKHIEKLGKDIGLRMAESGWKGLFGIDVILSSKTGEVFLLEINARQAASTTFESEQQRLSGDETLFDLHLVALSGESTNDTPQLPKVHGAQIILRRTSKAEELPNDFIQLVRKSGLNIITYETGDLGSDLVRIQSTKSLMKDPVTFAEEISRHLPALRSKNIIYRYNNLAIGGKHVRCPYFNNKKKTVRGGLRSLIGKGSPEEIVEEAELFAVREKANLSLLSREEIRNFLIEHNLGIDCSGYAFHYYQEIFKKQGKNFAASISWASKKSLLRKIISRLRPAENCGVRTFADKNNSFEVPLNEVRAGDFIVALTDADSVTADHIFMITERKGNVLSFTHAIAWPKDGTNGHGVHNGKIEIINPEEPVHQARWTDDSLAEEEYSLYLNKVAAGMSVRRLKGLAK